MSEVRVIRLMDCRPDAEVNPLGGQFLDDSQYDTLIRGESTDVYKPDGSPLLRFRSQIFSKEDCVAAWKALRQVNFGSANRGMAGGAVEGIEDGQLMSHKKADLKRGPKQKGRGSVYAQKGNVRMRPLKKDGTLSNTEYAATYAAGDILPSAVVGYYDRYSRIPYCRMTAFNLENKELFQQAMPYLRAIDRVFAEEMPERYAAQKAMIERTKPDWVIKDTVFTTITVNKSWRTACHKDEGDLKEGFGVMTALWAAEGGDGLKLQMGKAWGNYLIFPKYRVAVSMTAGDVLLADVHEWHGNSPFLGVEKAHERISLVCYMREKMVLCGTAEQEAERAKNRYARKGRPGEAYDGSETPGARVYDS